jgi:hypothetical protein
MDLFVPRAKSKKQQSKKNFRRLVRAFSHDTFGAPRIGAT